MGHHSYMLQCASASLAVSGFIWQRIVKPAQRDWHFFGIVLAGGGLCSSLRRLSSTLQHA